MRSMMKTVWVLAVMAVVLSASMACADESVGQTLRKMTGARTKLAWIRGSQGIGHPFGPGMGFDPYIWRIVVVDTDENGGKPRYLTERFGEYSHLAITANGKRVLWTGSESGQVGRVWISDWDGKNQHKLLDAGGIVGVAEDPPGTDWVYVKESPGTNGVEPIYRYQVDNLAKRELIWDKNKTNDKWEFSRDGKFACTRWNGWSVGIVAMPNGEENGHMVSNGGCTPGMAADLSVVMHMQAVGHCGIFIYNRDGTNERFINFTTGPAAQEGVVFPQFWWTSFAHHDARFFSFSGPHPGMNTLGQSKGDIYFCQFNEKKDGVVKWVNVSDYPEIETHSYAWIDSTPTPNPLAGFAFDAVVSPTVIPGEKFDITLSASNVTAQAWKGRARLVTDEGWGVRPSEKDLELDPGATKTVVMTVKPPKKEPTGKVRFYVEILDATGKTVDWIRISTKVLPPITVAAQMPRTIDEAKQPMDIRINNITDDRVSGSVRLELEGPAKRPAIDQAFGPISSHKSANVELIVPDLKLLGSTWTARFIVTAGDAEVRDQKKLASDRYWLVLGPFSNPPGEGFNLAVSNSCNGQGFEYAYEPEKELADGLDLTREYAQPSALCRAMAKTVPDSVVKAWQPMQERSAKLQWRTAPSEGNGFVDLGKACEPKVQAVAYALIYVKSPEARKATLALGPNDFAKAWVNGALVLQDKKYRPATKGELKAAVDLKAGWNQILLKVGNGLGSWGFFCDLTDAAGNPLPGLTYAVNPDAVK